MLRFPVKKIRKQFKLLLLLVLLTSAVWFTYLHINQGKTIKLHFNYGKDGQRQTDGTDASRKRDTRSSAGHHKSEDTSDSREDEAADDEPIIGGADSRDQTHIRKFLSQKQKKLLWKPEYKGQANLHVFEDWCGSSVAQLRKNLHFPLYPHTRTTVKKLAVAPKWKNYGLRIFGFLHPYKDGDFQFSVSSDDNSEFWLSPDECPLNARLLVYVGQLGTEWTAPGEFTKFRSQSSKSVHLISSRRYYFEILHKQDDKGSDHVEVGWRPFLPGLKYEVIDSAYISLYTDESSLKMNSVDHIPQTLASHIHLPAEFRPQGLEGDMITPHGADMLRPDPRDTFYSTPVIDPSRLQNVLPACLYSPTYVVKDFPIARYQGLQFVYLSFVYPNDFTRLTHMERENKCFYRESPIYLEKFGFYKYMKMDEEEDDRLFFFPNPDDFLEEEEVVDAEDEAEIVGTHSPRKPSHPSQSSHMHNSSHQHSKTGATPAGREEEQDVDSVVRGRTLSWVYTGPADQDLNKKAKAQGGRGDLEVPPKISKSSLLFPQKTSLSALTSRAKQILSNSAHSNYPHTNSNKPVGSKKEKREESKIYITRPRPAKEREKSETAEKTFNKAAMTKQLEKIKRKGESRDLRTAVTADLPSKRDIQIPLSYHQEPPPTPASETRLSYTENTVHSQLRVTSYLRTSEITESQHQLNPDSHLTDIDQDTNRSNPDPNPDPEQELEPEEGEMSDYSYEEVEVRPGWAEESINWQRTFSVNPMDFELLRSDWNDLRCNVSGNLQLAESEVVDVLAQYMEKLNERNGGIYTLLRIINVEKRRDSARGNRYLVELELMERGRSVVRLSEYIYLLLHRGRQGEHPSPSTRSSVRPGATPWSTAYAKPLLCQPVMLQWRRDVMVHFVVPVKNQARWVQQFISDMENLHQQTKDDNFSIIIVDFESEDMDVEQALRESRVPKYEYLRREGNFERSAGLQIGVDTIKDSHSIVFLCDLHIHFPLNILESIRKHCVEGRLAFAPIVMRLSCGSSPLEPNGYWEVNGFGLFGIYKSDFDKIGGMNTEEFKDRWGGEDWELLDRYKQNGKQLKKICLNLSTFTHLYFSKRANATELGDEFILKI
uniref:Beta-1,4-N-acetylgalactosaminyltransferase n=1 Tax=Poecilia formosa TaxID=48698 RepID=A0A087X6I6_POEFO